MYHRPPHARRTLIWRGWSFLAGLPVGVLAALASGAVRTPAALFGAALAGGGLLLAVVWWIGRVFDDDPARGAHLACAASGGLVALPALVSGPLQLRPGPLGWLVALLVLLSLLFFRAARVHAPSGGLGRQLCVAGGWLIGGALAVLGAGGLGAAAGGSGPVARDGRAESVYDADARVVTQPLPICADAPPPVRVLLERGARPRLDPEGEGLWFDARSGGGARQVHRLDLATGDVSCLTCDEPGNNVRPYPGRLGVVFETDRHADWLDPGNTEVHFLRRRGARAPGPSRRLTRSPGCRLVDAHS